MERQNGESIRGRQPWVNWLDLSFRQTHRGSVVKPSRSGMRGESPASTAAAPPMVDIGSSILEGSDRGLGR